MNRIMVISLMSSMLAVSGAYAASHTVRTTKEGLALGKEIRLKVERSRALRSPRRLVDLADSQSEISPSPVREFTSRPDFAEETWVTDDVVAASRLTRSVSASPITEAVHTRLTVEISPVSMGGVERARAIRRKLDVNKAARRYGRSQARPHGYIRPVAVPAATPIKHSERMKAKAAALAAVVQALAQ